MLDNWTETSLFCMSILGLAYYSLLICVLIPGTYMDNITGLLNHPPPPPLAKYLNKLYVSE